MAALEGVLLRSMDALIKKRDKDQLITSLGARLKPGNVHSADGGLNFIDLIVKRYRAKLRLFWMLGDAAFADPGVYKYCEGEKVTTSSALHPPAQQ